MKLEKNQEPIFTGCKNCAWEGKTGKYQSCAECTHNPNIRHPLSDLFTVSIGTCHECGGKLYEGFAKDNQGNYPTICADCGIHLEQ